MTVTIPFKRKKVIFDSLMTDNYYNYLESEEWEEFRTGLIDKTNGYCELCDKYVGNKGHVHHISYNSLFKEEDKDVIYICRECHLEA